MRVTYLLSFVSPLLLAITGCGPQVTVLDRLSGTVVDINDVPAPGVKIAIGDATAVTDDAGRFSFSAVEAPYDMTLALGDHTGGFVYQGLTSAELALKLAFIEDPAAIPAGAHVEIDLPLASDGSEHAAVIAERLDGMAPVRVLNASQPGPGNTDFVLDWPGKGGAQARLWAFRYTADASGAPQHYTGFATEDVSLQHGMSNTWTPSWQAPTFAEKKVSLSVDLPPDYHSTGIEIRMRQNGEQSEGVFATSMSTSKDVSFVVPDLDGWVFDVDACAKSSDSTSCRFQQDVLAGAETQSMPVEEGPELTSASPALDVGSTFAWRANGDGLGVLTFIPKTQPAPSFLVATAGDSFTFPDFSTLGVTLPKGVDYRVMLSRNGRVDTMDELAEKGSDFRPTDEGFTVSFALIEDLKTP